MGNVQTFTQGECHGKMKADIRDKPRNTKDGQQTPRS